MKPYNKDEVMKEWTESFTTINWAGERQLDTICVTNFDRETPIIQDESPIVKKHKDFLSTALDAAFQAGREDKVQEVRKRLKCGACDGGNRIGHTIWCEALK